jgi:hypothetical protein
VGIRIALAAAALCGLCCAAAAAQDAASAKSALDRAERIIKQHHLLTPKQHGCTSLLYRDDESSARTAKVGVYEVHDKACGGDPGVMHRLFDLEIDLTTGAAKWDNNFPDMEMRPVPQRAR